MVNNKRKFVKEGLEDDIQEKYKQRLKNKKYKI